MIRLFVGSLLVAVVLWAWSTLFYVISPIPYYTMSQTADDIAAGEALLEHFPETGTYILPGRYNGADVRSEMRNNGPVATIYFTREGSPEASVTKILIGSFNSVVIGLLIGFSMLLLNRHHRLLESCGYRIHVWHCVHGLPTLCRYYLVGFPLRVPAHDDFLGRF